MEHAVHTAKPEELIDITGIVRQTVLTSGVKDGIVTVFVPHTTAAVTINENADPDVIHDLLLGLNRIYPKEGGYRHAEGNSHAHLKASAMGSSCTVIIDGGRLKLGIWQGIYFCEFDGPRNRKVYIKVL